MITNAPQTILVTGVFDVLHQEHLAFLKKAKALGGKLLVGVETDERVRELKGEGRPVHTAAERVAQLKQLGIADEVVVLPQRFHTEAERLEWLKVIRPTILAVSSHTPHLAAKRRVMKQVGGEVKIVHALNPAVSTTKILQAQQQSR